MLTIIYIKMHIMLSKITVWGLTLIYNSSKDSHCNCILGSRMLMYSSCERKVVDILNRSASSVLTGFPLEKVINLYHV